MKSLFLLLIIVVGYGMAGGLQAQDPSAPRLLDVLVKTDALSASDKDFLDRRRSAHSILWAVPVTVEPNALNHSQLDVFLYDRHVRIIRAQGEGGAGNAWNGKVVLPGDPPGFDPGTLRDVRIVPLKRGGIFATIRVDDFVYQVARLSSGTQVLSKQDLSKLHQSPNDILFPELRIEPKAGARQRNEKSPDKIRLVIGFTVAAETAAGGYASLVDEVNNAILNAHTSYSSSDIDLELEIAAFARPVYSESSVYQALSDLYYVQGGMWLPHQARESEYADVVALVVEAPGDPVCGAAASLGSVKETAMFVVQRDCFASHVFAHELGHLIWADHNPEDASIPEPIISFAHGYRREAEPGVAGWSTVMSVTQSCQSSCPRQNKWSSPLHEHNGEPRGTAQTHDNARVLIQQKSVVAGFYPDPPATQMEHTSGTPKLYTPHGRLDTVHW